MGQEELEKGMDTRHLVDPELRGVLDNFPDFDLSSRQFAPLREGGLAALPDPATYQRPGIIAERFTVPGNNDLVLHVYRPAQPEGPLPLYLSIHGGGYVLGSALDTAPLDTHMADTLGCAVAAVEYRLAPEHPYPAPLDDCFDALQCLWQHADALGFDRDRFAVGGQSAGGGLAAALALRARDEGDARLCFQLLVYPMLDDRSAFGQPDGLTGEFIWTRECNAIGWDCYLGGQEADTAYAVPARCENLCGLPPAWICTGQLDLFLDENIAYARRLMAAHVPTELHVIPGAYHGFEMAADARITRESISARMAALAKAFA